MKYNFSFKWNIHSLHPCCKNNCQNCKIWYLVEVTFNATAPAEIRICHYECIEKEQKKIPSLTDILFFNLIHIYIYMFTMYIKLVLFLFVS